MDRVAEAPVPTSGDIVPPPAPLDMPVQALEPSRRAWLARVARILGGGPRTSGRLRGRFASAG
ncbi:MAG: hypothetical protein H6923_08625 [Alphaproteobacteria bacterium]|nr:hypothetical protein [Alphaproteobacteria bacterium]